MVSADFLMAGATPLASIINRETICLMPLLIPRGEAPSTSTSMPLRHAPRLPLPRAWSNPPLHVQNLVVRWRPQVGTRGGRGCTMKCGVGAHSKQVTPPTSPPLRSTTFQTTIVGRSADVGIACMHIREHGHPSATLPNHGSPSASAHRTPSHGTHRPSRDGDSSHRPHEMKVEMDIWPRRGVLAAE